MTDSTGKELKEAGIALVLDNEEGSRWAIRIRPTFLKFVATHIGQEVTAEDFRNYATPLCGAPHHPNAWGGVWSGFVKAKPARLHDTGRVAFVKGAAGHKRRIPIWLVGG